MGVMVIFGLLFILFPLYYVVRTTQLGGGFLFPNFKRVFKENERRSGMVCAPRGIWYWLYVIGYYFNLLLILTTIIVLVELLR